MSYFADRYARISYPMAGGAQAGLYNAQLGAIHALAAHFSVDTQPAIVTMPTGSGKTAVLTMLPFLLKSERVLVITPSRLVRGQIAEEFSALQTLRDVGVLPSRSALPKVFELANRITSPDGWEALREYDVIVSTPNCTSPGHEGIPEPSADLFDLVLIDEAHHSAARTWAALLATFKGSRRALFSATPFRRDRGEIPGRFVYNYPVARAYSDGIFGSIAYVQVEPGTGEHADVAIAKKTAEVFAQDRAANLDHYVMVRTDRRTRADELAGLYRRETTLRLRVIHSGLATKTVKSILHALENHELDGVICVNMLGEGFNFPRLKIAAVHSPHKSLEVTLQFIGRFARTNAPNIGQAKFIAVLTEIEFERKRLFDEGAVWEELIPDLSYGRIASEVHTREVLQEFDDPSADDARLEDLSLYSIYPRSHVKIYDVPGAIDLRNATLPLFTGSEICYRNVTADGTVLVLLVRILVRPKWSAGDLIVDRKYELLVLYFDALTHLLFINASSSVEGIYKELASALSNDTATQLPTSLVTRVVKDITAKRLFNVGMRNIQAANTHESYKIVTGSDAQIDPSEGNRYRFGHAFLAGEEHGDRITIGYSSGAKVWSSSKDQIPALLDWCRALGQKIRNEARFLTNSGLDYLEAGRVVTAIPEHVIYVQWHKDAFDFASPVQVEYVKDTGESRRCHISELDLILDRAATTTERISFRVVGEGGLNIPLEFSLTDFYTSPAGTQTGVTVTQGNWSSDLLEYLDAYHLDFYTADGALLMGNELFAPKERIRPIRDDQIVVWDWTGVDIEQEVTSQGGGQSVQQKAETELAKSDADIVFCDHGSGEVADYVAITATSDATVFAFYHCKGSGAPRPGARLEDVYEVCSQAQKSVPWSSVARLASRLAQRPHIRFVRGSRTQMNEVLERAKDRLSQFEMKLVQPGVSKAKLSDAMAECFGATSGHLGVIRTEVIGSA